MIALVPERSFISAVVHLLKLSSFCLFRYSHTSRLSAFLQGTIAPIAQSVEHLHGKEKVTGSNPVWGSNDFGGVAQVVEQAAHNRCVAGSTPALATSGKN